MNKPRVGIFGLTGCAGDQLVILNCEDELLDLLDLLDVRDFVMASSANDGECELDIAFVEGAVLSETDEKRLRRIRARSRLLVAIGTCAVCGGIPVMDRHRDRNKLLLQTYGKIGEQLDTMPTRAVHEVVDVDLSITGCPIEKAEFLSSVGSLLRGDPPLLPEYPVCAECKMREHNCLLVEQGEVCLGPLTVGGCGARCPGLGVACVGCRGPVSDPNVGSAMVLFRERGFSPDEIVRRLRTFAPIEVGALAD
jgi:coenzyme F420-reducing hydrogenase gamma subunit